MVSERWFVIKEGVSRRRYSGRQKINPTFYLTSAFRVLETTLCKEFFRAMKNLQTSLLLIADVCLIGIIGIIVA
jgi:hypothetical protein